MNQAFKFFGSYDIFGKSVPGTALILGVISFASTEDLLKLLEGPTLVNIASILVLLLLLGLMFGQGVHTLADNIEKLFHWLGRRARNLVLLTRTVFGRVRFWLFRGLDSSPPQSSFARVLWYITEGVRTILITLILPYIFVKWSFTMSRWRFEGWELLAEGPVQSLWKRVAQSWWNSTISWMHRRYWGIYDSLVTHRRLFAKSLEWNYEPNSGRWEKDSQGDLYKLFTQQYERIYGTQIQKNSPDEIATQYPLITGRLSVYGEGEYRHFQSIYSFCRSMWVVFLILTIAYSSQLYTSSIPVASPLWMELTPDGLEPFVPLMTLLVVGIFLDAAGTYKRHYVEYLISDFGVTESMQEDSEQKGVNASLKEF